MANLFDAHAKSGRAVRSLHWVFLLSAACTEVSGLSDYNVASHGEGGFESFDASVVDPDPDADSGEQAPVGDEAGLVMDGAQSEGGHGPTSTLDAGPDAKASDASLQSDVAMQSSDGDGGPAVLVCDAASQACDGQCVALDDPRHCGACGHDCTALAHVSGPVTCRDAQCVVPASSCATGFAHCSSAADDGCEADIAVAARCGSCSNACSAAAPLCSLSSTSSSRTCVSECSAPSPTKCAGTCVDTSSSPAHCGGCGSACPQVVRGTATCTASQCGFTCNTNHHKCGSQCLPDDSASSCGSSCTPCSAPANATAICATGGTCDFTCNANYHRCGAQCVANNAVSSCGSSCTPCSAPSNATAVCAASGSCDFACNANYHRCGNACVPDTSITQCGASCHACQQIANSSAQCVSGACSVTCDLGGAPANGVCRAPDPPNKVFVSTGKVSGSTGIAAADTMCQNEAASAGLAGNYRALLATETTSASSRLGSSRGWVRPDGKPFADRIEDFFASDSDGDHIFYPPRITAAGMDAGRAWVLTGSTFSGAPRPGYTCASWTVTDGSSSGFGYASGAGYVFSALASTGCSTQFSVYCFGVGNVSRVSATPVNGRKAFISKGNWGPGSGIASADALCQSEATSAGFSGTFRALLASDGASAASRFNTSGLPWVRPDGVPLMPSAAQVFQSNVTLWDVALNTTADLSRQYGNWLVYSGEPSSGAGVNPLTQPGTAASTCDNWTSAAAGSGRGGMGTAADSSLLEAFADKQWGCNYGGAARIVCLQQ